MSEQNNKMGWGWPFTAPAEAMKAFEAFMGERGQELLRNERLLKGAGKTMEASMQAKSQWDRLMEEWMGNMHMATSGQVEELARRVDEVDRRLDGISEQLYDVLDALKALQETPKQAEAKKPAPKKAEAKKPAPKKPAPKKAEAKKPEAKKPEAPEVKKPETPEAPKAKKES